MKIGCIVLAAGHSRRFGKEEKLLQPLGNRPLLAHTLSALPEVLFSSRCVVTSSAPVEELCRSLSWPCAAYEGGLMSDSIRVGLASMPGDLDGFLFVNGDRPFLAPDTVRRMVLSFAEKPLSAVRLTWNGIPSNPVLFPASARQQLASLTGDQGGGALLKQGTYVTIPVQASSEYEVLDIDDQTMLTQANQILQIIAQKE